MVLVYYQVRLPKSFEPRIAALARQMRDRTSRLPSANAVLSEIVMQHLTDMAAVQTSAEPHHD
jgi:hypothetical protein